MKSTKTNRPQPTSTAAPRRSSARIAKQRSKRTTEVQEHSTLANVARKKLEDYGAEIARLTLENVALKDAVERLQSETARLGSGGRTGVFKAVV
ncbi:hypothetical protein W97_04358 [Coniosporium apollinis CBS 100218]|uniref:Uncharacterized protein n=1 Tax=Coniosporium apollinis (strain CBS 100218) TaxID=1168221 RepID=R7YTZ4_CONA1|nr:uncharacterized protein W97_04358 [Coniosporium apollinis CBS 100218]EON65121.1 hypothetical protein W97_04358 [Coniosporium apollinis CBS 100218]